MVVTLPAVGAIKPWQLFILSLCCLVPLAAAAVAGFWVARRDRK